MNNQSVVLDLAQRQTVFFHRDDTIYMQTDSETTTVFEGCKDDFCAICDESGRLHLICQDMDGNVYYLLRENSWEQTCILESKNKNASQKNFSLISQNGWINAFYILPQKQNSVLVHHVINMESYKVVDYVTFDAVCAFKQSDDIIAIYQNEDKTLGFSRYIWKEKTWGEFSVLYKAKGNLSCVSAFSDEGILRCVFLEELYGKHQLIYLTENDQSIQTKRIFGNAFSDSDPAIFKTGNRIYIVFGLGIRALTCHSEDGISFSSPIYMYPTFYKAQRRVRLTSAVPLESVGLLGSDFYAIETDESFCDFGLIASRINQLKPPQRVEKKEDILEFANIEESAPLPWEIEIGKLKAEISILQGRIKDLTKEKQEALFFIKPETQIPNEPILESTAKSLSKETSDEELATGTPAIESEPTKPEDAALEDAKNADE